MVSAGYNDCTSSWVISLKCLALLLHVIESNNGAAAITLYNDRLVNESHVTLRNDGADAIMGRCDICNDINDDGNDHAINGIISYDETCNDVNDVACGNNDVIASNTPTLRVPSSSNNMRNDRNCAIHGARISDSIVAADASLI